MYSCISRIAVSVRCLKKSFSANSLARSALESLWGSEIPSVPAQQQTSCPVMSTNWKKRRRFSQNRTNPCPQVGKRGGGNLQTGQIRVHRLEKEQEIRSRLDKSVSTGWKKRRMTSQNRPDLCPQVGFRPATIEIKGMHTVGISQTGLTTVNL